MAKGILLLDYLPTRCCDCELRNDIAIGKTICHVTLKDLTDDECFKTKPQWCPLKELSNSQKGVADEESETVMHVSE